MVKRNGVVVDFDRSILERSLVRAGAAPEFAKKLSEKIEVEITDGDRTDEIYRKAFTLLNESAKPVALRYSLKKALFNFGPTGFPFEKFVAELFRRKGYTTTTNVQLQGKCISHEVDVMAIGKERVAMEVKFHNSMHIRSDVKAILYVKARFDDLIGKTNGWTILQRGGVVDRCILVTNTKFTRNAIAYAKCAGVTLLGWGYPYGNNLEMLIKELDAHPITCLPSISTATAKELFAKGIVTCRGLMEQEEVLRQLPKAQEITNEAELLCTPRGRK